MVFLHKSLNRPAIIAGLSFFLFSCIISYSQNLPANSSLKDIFFYQPVNLLELPDSTQIHFSDNYDPLLSEKPRSSQDNFNSLINSNDMQMSCFLNTSQIKYHLSCSYSDFFAAYRDEYQKYSFQNQRKEWDPSIGILYSGGEVSYGFGIGRHLADYMHIEHLSEISDDPLKYITHGPWQFSLATSLRIKHSDLHLSMFSGPVHSSLSKLITIDGNSYRSFPISLLKRTADIGVNLNVKQFSSKTDVTLTNYENIDLLIAPNSMPQDIEIARYGLSHEGTLKSALSDSLFWKLSGNIAGGWIASYNFDRDRLTVFKANSIRSSNFSALIGLRLPRKLTSGISGNIYELSCPTGFLKLSGFSAWSVFNPIDYRFTDVKMKYYEMGIFLNRKFSRSWIDVTPNMYVSYVKTWMSLNYAHKEIIVLFPVYVKPESLNVFNNQFLFLTPSLVATVHAGQFDITASILQRMPISIISAIYKISDNPDDDNTQKRASFSGGTSLSIKAIWNISRKK